MAANTMQEAFERAGLKPPSTKNNFVTLTKKELVEFWDEALFKEYKGAYGKADTSPLFKFICAYLGLR